VRLTESCHLPTITSVQRRARGTISTAVAARRLAGEPSTPAGSPSEWSLCGTATPTAANRRDAIRNALIRRPPRDPSPIRTDTERGLNTSPLPLGYGAVRVARLELARPHGQRCLRPPWLPLHHTRNAQRLRGSNSHGCYPIAGFKPVKHASLANLREGMSRALDPLPPPDGSSRGLFIRCPSQYPAEELNSDHRFVGAGPFH
jgi:hypothetical protein